MFLDRRHPPCLEFRSAWKGQQGLRHIWLGDISWVNPGIYRVHGEHGRKIPELCWGHLLRNVKCPSGKSYPNTTSIYNSFQWSNLLCLDSNPTGRCHCLIILAEEESSFAQLANWGVRKQSHRSKWKLLWMVPLLMVVMSLGKLCSVKVRPRNYQYQHHIGAGPESHVEETKDSAIPTSTREAGTQ